MPDIAARLNNTGQLLVRSGIEIDRVLSAMVDDRAAVSATLAQQVMFVSRLVAVDPVKQRLRIACSETDQANKALLALRSVAFRCHHRWGHLAFSCAAPRALTTPAKQQVIEMESPGFILAMRQNGRHVNGNVPKAAPDLRCQIRMDALKIEARLVDLSLDGQAFLVADTALPACAGTWLRDVRITPPGKEPVSVEIEVKYVIPTVLADGERVTRVGCRIAGRSEVIEELVSRFVISLN